MGMCKTRRRILSGSGIRSMPGAYLRPPRSGSSSCMAPGEKVACVPAPRAEDIHISTTTIPSETVQIRVRKERLLLLLGGFCVCWPDIAVNLLISQELVRRLGAHIVDLIGDPTTIAGQVEVVVDERHLPRKLPARFPLVEHDVSPEDLLNLGIALRVLAAQQLDRILKISLGESMAHCVEFHGRLEIAGGPRNILLGAAHGPVKHPETIHGEWIVCTYRGGLLEIFAGYDEEVALQSQQTIVSFE